MHAGSNPVSGAMKIIKYGLIFILGAISSMMALIILVAVEEERNPTMTNSEKLRILEQEVRDLNSYIDKCIIPEEKDQAINELKELLKVTS